MSEWKIEPSGAAQGLLEDDTLTQVLDEVFESGVTLVCSARLDESGEDLRREGAARMKAVNEIRRQLKTLAAGVPDDGGKTKDDDEPGWA